MIGIWGAHSSTFMIVTSTLTLLLGGPMLIHPLGWARALRWTLPEQTDLAIYFGRCLGGVIVALAMMGFVAVGTPMVQPFYFTLMLTAVGINIIVHVWGAIQKIQPLTETVEITIWVLLFVAGFMFYPLH